MNSHSHPMMGSVSAWFYKYLAGINADPPGPGFKRFVLRPYPVRGLEWVRAEYSSPYGAIRNSWRREGDGRLSYEVEVPANSTATVYVPAVDADHVREHGKPASSAEGVKWLRKQDGYAVFAVGSGKYEFSAFE